MNKIVGLTALFGAVVVGAAGVVRRGRNWGSTPDERSMHLPGDTYLEGGPEARTMMTRAISISAPPEVVWPWLAQMGRGAGWYSYDRLDNGGRASARHIVSWIPSPSVGDASAIGWLRNLDPGQGLTWWIPGEQAFGTMMRMVTDIRLDADGPGSRLIVRISVDATGTVGRLVLHVFEAVDSIMAIRQLEGIRSCSEAFGARDTDPATPENGERDQFQLYETIWASGERAGTRGQEKAAFWRQHANV